jgi:hypothetical protein
MNNYYKGLIDNFPGLLLRGLRLTNKKDPFIMKKLTDYYFSNLLPNFFYHTPLPNNYYPTIVAARITISLGFLFLFGRYIYKRRFVKTGENGKAHKYGLDIYSKKFINYEKELILFEKTIKEKIIF